MHHKGAPLLVAESDTRMTVRAHQIKKRIDDLEFTAVCGYNLPVFCKKIEVKMVKPALPIPDRQPG